jgi:hypothetical protein
MNRDTPKRFSKKAEEQLNEAIRVGARLRAEEEKKRKENGVENEDSP